MKAEVGDRIAIMSRHLDEAVREGEIVAVHGAAGAPPYVVHWLDTGHTGVLFPGPDAVVQHPRGHAEAGGATPASAPSPMRTAQWNVTVGIVEYSSGKTRAHVIADTGLRSVQAHGEAQRIVGDVEAPQIGAEVAAGRAFLALGDELLGQATRDIEDVEDGHRAAVPRTPQ